MLPLVPLPRGILKCGANRYRATADRSPHHNRESKAAIRQAAKSANGAIITAEAATGVLFVVGALALWRVRLAPAATFNRAKGYAIAAGALAFLIWFFGFMVVGGEWFAMWESQTWNGQEAAFRFYIAILAVLILLNQPDID